MAPVSDLVVIVRCPRCGSMDADSVEEVGIELDRMRCAACGHEQLCDEHQIRYDWNELVPPGAINRVQWHWLPGERFRDLWRALGARDAGHDILDRLRAAYDEPHRAYHGSRHIGACLRLLDRPDVTAAAERPAEVEAALWFHDAVYDTRATDNEDRSAILARDSMRAAGIDDEAGARVAAIVLATKAHVADSADAALAVDVDLAILGADPAAFAAFEEGIRREYAWVDDAAYIAGRGAVLRGFVTRPYVFTTPVLRALFEARAQENLARALQRLGAEGGA